jgi:uncharacterized damage-inducible protein DinB
MSERITFLAKRLREEGEKTLAFFRAIPPEKWRIQVYSDGPTWTIHEILCHFVDAEHRLRGLVADVLAGGPGAPESMDMDFINATNATHVAELAHREPAALLDAFAEARQKTIAAFEQTDEANLDRVGRHPVMGPKPAEEIIKLIYVHNKGHQRDIQRALGDSS